MYIKLEEKYKIRGDNRMSGYTGIYGPMDEHSIQILTEMSERIVHRGTLEHTEVVNNTFALSQRKIAFQGEPCLNFNSTLREHYKIGYDGRLNDTEDLRTLLKNDYGVQLETNTDEELILSAYHYLGSNMMEHIKGLFSFVIYDTQTKQLFGARDRLGTKPLYYTQVEDHFLFSSEMKSFLSYPNFKKEVNKKALKLYLEAQYNPLNETMIKGVYKLEQGTYFNYLGNDIELKRYFEFKYDVDKSITFEEAVEKIQKAVKKSLAYNIEGIDSFGAYLSGGIDSSYIVGSVEQPINTYTAAFEQEGFDESIFSKDLSERLGKTNFTRSINGDDFFEILPKVQYHSDEPHANLSAIPLYFLSELTSQEEDIVLSGEGADELFGGYDTYLISKASTFYSSIVPLWLRGKINEIVRSRPYFKGQGFLEKNGVPLSKTFIGQSQIMSHDEANELLSSDYQMAFNFYDVTKPYFERAQKLGYDTLHQKMYLDLHVWMPNDIFLKGDRMAMANSQTVRMPFLSEEMWNIARTLPSHYLVDQNISKKVFRRAAADSVPADWANRKKKGFMVPIRYWLQEDKYYHMVKEMFEKDFVAQFFNQDLLLKWLEDHKNKVASNQRKIYTVYAFLVWYQNIFVNQVEKVKVLSN